MDFFKHQDQARKKTGLLILLFVLAVMLIALAVNVVVFLVFSTGDDLASRINNWMMHAYWEHPTAAVVLLVFFGSLSRYFALSGGGKAVAEMISAKPVDLASTDKNEKKYINIVSEMSIASGVPMPVLYVMEREQGINAFVAGYGPTEAVMVVTRGALEELNRDELQGVVAHEFSHILNGDMRINIRLMAILAGILTIGQFGRVIMRSASHGHSKRNSGPLVIVGLMFFIIGYIGLFSGRLIKAAISRQREYLADASSVQFTRNPRGIAGALYKIRESVHRGYLGSNRAEEMSHMCFASSLPTFFESLLATHPPLDVRINAIDPLFLKTQRAKTIIQERSTDKETNKRGQGYSGNDIVNSIGNPGAEHLVYAALMYKSLSSFLIDLLHSKDGAQAIVYGLIISRMDYDQGIEYLSVHCDQAVVNLTVKVIEPLSHLDKRNHLPIIDLVLPVLKSLDGDKRKTFIENSDELIKMDKRISLFEFVLLIVISQHLDKKAETVTPVKYHSFKPVVDDIHVLISMMAQTSRQSDEKNRAVFDRVMKTFVSVDMPIIPARDCHFKMLLQALNRLSNLTPMLKKSLITACVDCVIDDGIVMSDEAELLRAVAESLDCPVPPLLQ